MDTEGNSRGDPERQERLQDSSAGFTAVNGQDSPVRGVPSHPVGSDLHARSRQGSSEHRPLETKPMAQDPEGWAFTPRNVDKGTTRENQGPQKNDLPISSPGKRKRADSEAEEDSGSAISPYDVGSSSSGQIRQRMDSYASNGPRRESTETAEHAAPGSARQPRVDERSEPHPIPYTHQDVDNNKESGSWYHRERVESPGSDIQLAEALQRDAQAQQQSRANGDGGNESTSPQAPNGSGVQLDPNAKNKRKRMFSNRTKTGCQTCRRRKKKCDEQKPECSNCIRGGFVCEGYTVKTAWSKPGTLTKQPIPLQSKEGYPDQNNMYPKSVTSFSDAYFSRPREENFEHHSGFPPRPPREQQYVESAPPSAVDGARNRPIMVEDDHSQQRQPSWSAQSWGPEPAQRNFPQDRPMTNDYNRPAIQQEQPRPIEPHRPGSHSSQVQQSMPPMHNAPMTAQLALQRQPTNPASNVRPAPPSTQQPMLSEKEKMFKGEKYLPFSQQLVEERENCKAALWRFNHSMDPGRGVTREERTRLFKAILQPSWIPRRTNQSSPNPHPIGSLGSDVCVEAPFYCEYGYNINIGPDVVIGPNCTILDPCIIIISARCIIGPNVNIYGNSVDLHPARRQGSKGPAQGKRIVIEEDCFIGGNVTICPGVTIGKGSTVAAGSVVINDIPRYVLAAGNPTRVVRGMYGVGQG